MKKKKPSMKQKMDWLRRKTTNNSKGYTKIEISIHHLIMPYLCGLHLKIDRRLFTLSPRDAKDLLHLLTIAIKDVDTLNKYDKRNKSSMDNTTLYPPYEGNTSYAPTDEEELELE